MAVGPIIKLKEIIELFHFSSSFTLQILAIIIELKKHYTIIIVTHNMQQALRVSDRTGFMYLGDLVEYDKTETIFKNPKKELTANYVQGRFG